MGGRPMARHGGGSGGSATVPPRQLVNFEETDGLNQISRENGKRLVVIQTNVRGRDVGTFVAEAQAKVRDQVTLPTGTYLEWGGQFESLQSASRRMAIVIPIVAVMKIGRAHV